MPAYSSSLPILTLLTNDADEPRRERPIDRTVLLDIAPDRENLILSEKSIDEIRQILKIRVASSNAGHWLYRHHNRTRTTTDVQIQIQDPTSRLSTYLPRDTPETTREESTGQTLHVIRRRVLSASSISPLCLPLTSIENRLASAGGGLSFDIWSHMTLSTADKLVSPRPLGPTHVLIAHTTPPKPNSGPQRRNRTLRGGESTPAVVHPKTLELPINDLLFTLNVPNLRVHVSPTTPALPALPRRLPKELPRVSMYVPHLETFAELVVYLHTKNQAELFRGVVPEWMRDVMHPLPLPIPTTTATTTAAAAATVGSGGSVTGVGESRGVGCRVGWLFGFGFGFGAVPDSSLDQHRPTSPQTERSIGSIARELAEAAAAALAIPGSSAGDPLLQTTSRLDALRDNLEYVGYFGRDVWSELEMCREILVRAVSCGAKVEGCIEREG